MKNITRKFKQQRVAMTLGLAMPMFVLLVGCNEKNKSSVNGVPDSDRVTTTAPVDANNSRVNVRDRNDATLTPGDQGNSEVDRDITQRVRKSLVSGPTDYSITAKNIKIITVDGKVTLRGPVNTVEEKTSIAALANSVAGDGNVDDQLEVKANQ